MSRIGVRPIKIEEGVTVSTSGDKIIVENGEKKAQIELPAGISIKVQDGQAIVNRTGNEKESRAAHGLITRLLSNAITGVKDGFKKELEFKGTGYRAAIDNNELVLNMGYSHEIRLAIPSELSVAVVKNSIIITGIDKQKVGEFAAIVRDVRGPEVYKGKGIKYKTELIKRKAGKKAAKA